MLKHSSNYDLQAKILDRCDIFKKNTLLPEDNDVKLSIIQFDWSSFRYPIPDVTIELVHNIAEAFICKTEKIKDFKKYETISQFISLRCIDRILLNRCGIRGYNDRGITQRNFKRS